MIGLVIIIRGREMSTTVWMFLFFFFHTKVLLRAVNSMSFSVQYPHFRRCCGQQYSCFCRYLYNINTYNIL